MDKIRLLRSEDVKHGSPQYFIHKKNPDSPRKSASGGWEPFSSNHTRSQCESQHLIIFRGQDPKPLGTSDPHYRSSGQVYVQDAFDRMGKLRLGSDDAITNHPGVRVKSWPVTETDGGIYVFFGEGKDGVQQIADSAQIDRGVMLPGIDKGRDSLSKKLTRSYRNTLETILQDELTDMEKRRLAEKKSDPAAPAPVLAPPQGTASYGISPIRNSPKPPKPTPELHRSAAFAPTTPEKHYTPPLGGFLRKARVPATEQVGATDEVESPAGTARSSWGTPRSDVSGLTAMLEDLEADEKARKYLGMGRRRSTIIEDLQAPAVLMTEKLRKEEDERLEEEKVLLKAEIRASKEAIQQHRKVRLRKQQESDVAQAERNQSVADLVPIQAAADPLRKDIELNTHRVEVQKAMLHRYKAEHGEKGIYTTLKRELQETYTAIHKLERELAGVEPKEKAKMKQIHDREARLVVAHRVLKKANSRTLALEARLEAAQEAMEEYRVRLLNRNPDDLLVHASEESNKYKALGRTRSIAKLQDSLPANARDSNDDEEDPGWEHAGKAHLAGPKGEDAENYKLFSSPEAIFRRGLLFARATSPRWRQRIADDMGRFAMFAPAVIKPPMWVDEEPPVLHDLWRQHETYFDCKIRCPVQLALQFEIFCRAPPAPYEPCTLFEVLAETHAGQCFHVQWRNEPDGYLGKLLLTFRKPEWSGKGNNALLDQMSIIAQSKREVANYSSLRERWASEGLVFDSTADMQSTQLERRAMETWQEHDEMKVQDVEYENAPAIPNAPVDPMVVWKVPLFKTSKIDFVRSLVSIIEVVEMPPCKRLLDQGALSDNMFIVESGELLCHTVICSQQTARDLAAVPPQNQVPPTRVSKTVCTIGPGEGVNAVGLLDAVPLDYSYESVVSTRLYRIRRESYLKLLPKFPGEYEKLFRLSHRRAPEWKGANFAARAMAASGIAFSQKGKIKGSVSGHKPLSEYAGRAEKSKDDAHVLFMDQVMKLKRGDEEYDCHVVLKKHPELPPEKTFVERMVEERSAKQAEAAAEDTGLPPSAAASLGEMTDRTVAWGNNGFHFSTEKSGTTPVMTDRELRMPDWWKDKAPELSSGAIGLAEDHYEKARAMEIRCTANVWRVEALRMKGRAMLDKIV